MGGKTRIAKQLAAVIDEYREPGQPVWDAFCGGLSMSVALSKKGPVYSTDACAPLIALYKAVQAGWDPPTEVSRETWQAAKSLPDSDPMKAFCGFGCSFGGKWFTSYAVQGRVSTYTRGPQVGTKIINNPHQATRKSLLRDVPRLGSIELMDFFSISPYHTDQIIYCDPPYKGTGTFNATLPFDSNLFVALLHEWSRYAHVFVSEYDLAIGDCIWSREIKFGQFAGGRNTEKLYYIAKGSLP